MLLALAPVVRQEVLAATLGMVPLMCQARDVRRWVWA